MKPITDYLQDATNLQAAVLAYGSRVLIQKRSFYLSTLGGNESIEGLRTQLKVEGTITVRIDPMDPMWKNYYRVRMQRVR
jgi:hypothetical protein